MPLIDLFHKIKTAHAPAEIVQLWLSVISRFDIYILISEPENVEVVYQSDIRLIDCCLA